MSRFGGRHFGPPLVGVASSLLGSFLLIRQSNPNDPSRLTSNNTTSCQGRLAKLVFLGTGSSTGCPRPLCPLVFGEKAVLTPELKELRKNMEDECKVSTMALSGTPKHNKNYRNNPSLLLQTDTGGTVVIDVGKTFREGALRWLPDHGVTGLDAIVLTHEHMDAAAGLDDVRGFQKRGPQTQTGKRPKNIATPIYLSQHCYTDLQERFPWLLPKPQEQQEPLHKTQAVVERHVASFDVHVFQDYEAFTPVPGLDMIPLPVLHGEDLISYGYAFVLGETSVVYLSDLSRMLPETLDFIKKRGPPDILIIDSLHPKQFNPVHYHMDDALALAKELKAAKVYLVGMSCDSFLPHDEQNEVLLKEYGNVQLAHDGLTIAC